MSFPAPSTPRELVFSIPTGLPVPGTDHPTYRPFNVSLIAHKRSGKPTLYVVLDFDGTVYSSSESLKLAVHRANVRRGVIKAARTRRANKARKAAVAS